MVDMCLPEELRKVIAGQPFHLDDVGLSGSRVLLFADSVLKIRPATLETQTEHKMMIWLDGRLPVPRCLCHTVEDGVDYLLMSRISGSMACDEEHMRNPELLVLRLAETLKQIWRVGILDCPVRWDLQRKLAAAKSAVDLEAVDVASAEPGTFGPGGFRSPRHLLEWLVEHQPEEDLVLSHGDFCLPNVFIDDNGLAGLVDLGRMGVADRWQDIALCYRSLSHNYSGKYSGTARRDFNPNSLFDALAIEPDWGKLDYYILVDELF